MHPEIRELIKLAIADGEITEKERAVIMRKAEKLCEDINEVEMILDGELALIKKEQKAEQSHSSTSNKEGVLKKCPSCGAPVKSFVTTCAECGHEFRQIEAINPIKKLYAELAKIEQEERDRPRHKFEIDKQLKTESAIASRQATAISSFPFSNTKEDILEFLSMAASEALVKPSFLERTRREPRVITWQAWRSKCQQVIFKARFSMKDDKSTLDKIENYAKQLDIK